MAEDHRIDEHGSGAGPAHVSSLGCARSLSISLSRRYRLTRSHGVKSSTAWRQCSRTRAAILRHRVASDEGRGAREGRTGASKGTGQARRVRREVQTPMRSQICAIFQTASTGPGCAQTHGRAPSATRDAGSRRPEPTGRGSRRGPTRSEEMWSCVPLGVRGAACCLRTGNRRSCPASARTPSRSRRVRLRAVGERSPGQSSGCCRGLAVSHRVV